MKGNKIFEKSKHMSIAPHMYLQEQDRGAPSATLPVFSVQARATTYL